MAARSSVSSIFSLCVAYFPLDMGDDRSALGRGGGIILFYPLRRSAVLQLFCGDFESGLYPLNILDLSVHRLWVSTPLLLWHAHSPSQLEKTTFPSSLAVFVVGPRLPSSVPTGRLPVRCGYRRTIFGRCSARLRYLPFSAPAPRGRDVCTELPCAICGVGPVRRRCRCYSLRRALSALSLWT